MYRGVSCGLARNILPAYTKMMQGCTSGLVSQNNRFFLVLGGYNLTLYENLSDQNLSMACANNSFSGLNIIFNIPFDGGYKSSLIIEDNSINIYSATTNENTDYVVKSIPFIKKSDFSQQYTLVLTNDGKIKVNDINNQSVGSIDSSSFGESKVPYNKIADYTRRLLNLKQFLIFRNIYIEADINQQKTNSKSNVKITIPQFNSQTNYIQRMKEFLDYLATHHKIDPNSSYIFRQHVITQTGMDINGLVPDSSNDLDNTFAQSSQKPSSDQLGTGSGTPPSQDDVVQSVHSSYTKKQEASQAEYNSKINNEANPSLQTCPKPECIGPNCPPPKTTTSYTSKNQAPSLSSLQDISGANNIYASDNEFDILNTNTPSDPTEREIYMAARLAALKAYLEIKNNMN